MQLSITCLNSSLTDDTLISSSRLRVIHEILAEICLATMPYFICGNLQVAVDSRICRNDTQKAEESFKSVYIFRVPSLEIANWIYLHRGLVVKENQKVLSTPICRGRLVPGNIAIDITAIFR